MAAKERRFPKRYGHPVGMLVREDPAAAARQLRQLFGEHATLTAVARELGVNATTVRRWARLLEAHGFRLPILPRGRIPNAA